MLNKSTNGRRLIWVLLLLAGLAACGSSDDAPPPSVSQRGDLVSATRVTTISVDAVDLWITALRLLGVDTTGLNAKYGVALYKIVYKTVAPDGRLINASGALAYPLKLSGAASPVLSFQHETAFLHSEAPSNNASNNQALLVLAGIGYVTLMPDYIGYAESGNEVHTFVLAQGLAAATIDMLRASRRLLANNNINTNGQLFLTGYSEGGYATLAAQKEMEQNLASEFQITASLPAAGPYDLSSTMQYMVGQPTNDNPQLVGFVFKAYDHWYRWNRINDIFQSPYNAVIASQYDGQHNSGTIKAGLTTAMADLFTSSFRSAFLGSGETAIKLDLAANDIYNWAPRTPTRLFHGQDDSIVPYANATTALTAMRAAGATNVTLIECTTLLSMPRGHEQCVPDYLTEVFSWFGSLANDL